MAYGLRTDAHLKAIKNCFLMFHIATAWHSATTVKVVTAVRRSATVTFSAADSMETNEGCVTSVPTGFVDRRRGVGLAATKSSAQSPRKNSNATRAPKSPESSRCGTGGATS